MTKTIKRIVAFLLISIIIYFGICLVLIYWPISFPNNIKNYDFSSIEKNYDAPLGDHQWIQMRDGSELFCRIYDSKNKDVLILMHGSGSESRYLASLANFIADNNLATVMTPDLRGHGENRGSKGDIDYIGQLEDDIEDLIKYSKTNLDAKSIILAGHSSGGGMVLRYIGNQKNSEVDKAIMLAPYLGYKAPTVKPNSGGWVTVAYKRIIGLSMLNNLKITGLNGLPVLFFNRPKEYNDKLQVPSYSFRMTLNFTPKNYKNDISNINIPSLVLVGEQDEGFYPKQFKIEFQPAKKYVKTIIIPNTNHLNIVNNQHTFSLIKEWMIKN